MLPKFVPSLSALAQPCSAFKVVSLALSATSCFELLLKSLWRCLRPKWFNTRWRLLHKLAKTQDFSSIFWNSKACSVSALRSRETVDRRHKGERNLYLFAAYPSSPLLFICIYSFTYKRCIHRMFYFPKRCNFVREFSNQALWRFRNNRVRGKYHVLFPHTATIKLWNTSLRSKGFCSQGTRQPNLVIVLI